MALVMYVFAANYSTCLSVLGCSIDVNLAFLFLYSASGNMVHRIQPNLVFSQPSSLCNRLFSAFPLRLILNEWKYEMQIIMSHNLNNIHNTYEHVHVGLYNVWLKP